MVASSKEILVIEQGIKKAFSRVREELDDHLDTINQNSSEIQSLYEFMMSLEKKVDKLSEQVQELHFIPAQKELVIGELTLREQEVFLALYAGDNPVSLEMLASSLGFSLEALDRYVSNLMSKNVPILRHTQQSSTFLSLELRFKELQARSNVVKIDPRISEALTAEKII